MFLVFTNISLPHTYLTLSHSIGQFRTEGRESYYGICALAGNPPDKARLLQSSDGAGIRTGLPVTSAKCSLCRSATFPRRFLHGVFVS
jgi:hypothetical protein